MSYEEELRWTNSDMWATITDHEKKLREQIAQEIERERRLNHETHALPFCADCHANEILDKAAAIARGKK